MLDRLSPTRKLAAVLILLSFLVVYYSQSVAFTWDAGFHLVTAQMIIAGKRPYLDFPFPQTPLNAYWTALWMRLLGQSWRVPQGLAALETMAAVTLAAGWVYRRFPVERWRLAVAVVTAVVFSLNELIFRFGTIAQAYAVCTLLTMAAFCLATGTPERRSLWGPAAVGLLAGAAAGCSLLSAAGAPVLLSWVVLRSRKGKRWAKAAAFVTAGAVPFLPLVRLFLLGPSQTWFNIFQYQVAFRHAKWGGTAGHDVAELSGWLDSTQGLVLLLLAAAAFWFFRRPECAADLRAEFHLSAWLALGLGLEAALARPTFARYFVLVVPFLAILAGPGFYEAMTRLRGAASGTLAPVAVLALLTVMGGARVIYDNSDVYRWKDLQKVAAKIRQVTPPNALIYASEPLYFLLRIPPPEGLQFSYSRELDLPPAQSAQLHIVREKDLDQRVAAGAFATVSVCLDQETVDRLKLTALYRKTEEIEYCKIFWDRAEAPR